MPSLSLPSADHPPVRHATPWQKRYAVPRAPPCDADARTPRLARPRAIHHQRPCRLSEKLSMDESTPRARLTTRASKSVPPRRRTMAIQPASATTSSHPTSTARGVSCPLVGQCHMRSDACLLSPSLHGPYARLYLPTRCWAAMTGGRAQDIMVKGIGCLVPCMYMPSRESE